MLVVVNKHIDGLVQERCNSIANALKLRLSYTKPSIFSIPDQYMMLKFRESLFYITNLCETNKQQFQFTGLSKAALIPFIVSQSSCLSKFLINE